MKKEEDTPWWKKKSTPCKKKKSLAKSSHFVLSQSEGGHHVVQTCGDMWWCVVMNIEVSRFNMVAESSWYTPVHEINYIIRKIWKMDLETCEKWQLNLEFFLKTWTR